jgi:hypothetical protein
MNDLDVVFICIISIIALIAILLLIIAATKNKSASEKKDIPAQPAAVIPEPKIETHHPLAERYEIEFGGNTIPPGMKECYQCKTLIRADALTCPQCGKDPSKAVAIGDLISKIGMIPIYLIILLISGCCLWSVISSWLGS